MKTMYTIALVGCGAISRKHIEGMVENAERCRLSAVCDIDASRAKSTADLYAQRSGNEVPPVLVDFEEMLENVQPDIVAIATSSFLHSSMAIAALEHGCHIVVEKPLALATADTHRIVEAASVRGKRGTVCHVLRFAPHFRRLKRALDRGALGRILHADFMLHWNRGAEYYSEAAWRGTWDRDGGVLMNQATHGVDLLQWVLGGHPSRVQAVGRRFLRPIEAEDFATAIVEFANGSVGTIVATSDAFPANHDATLSIFGEEGTIVIGGKGLNEVITWACDDRPGSEDAVKEPVGHTAVYADFLSALDGEIEPTISLSESCISVDIVLGAYQSMSQRKAVESPFHFSTKEMSGLFQSANV